MTCAAGSANSTPPAKVTSASISEPARKNLANAAAACRRFGWLSFWTQLVLSVVSAIILLFSVAFTSMVSKNRACQLPVLPLPVFAPQHYTLHSRNTILHCGQPVSSCCLQPGLALPLILLVLLLPQAQNNQGICKMRKVMPRAT